jgi:hypothetical protein
MLYKLETRWVRFDVLKEVTTKVYIFCHMAPCTCVEFQYTCREIKLRIIQVTRRSFPCASLSRIKNVSKNFNQFLFQRHSIQGGDCSASRSWHYIPPNAVYVFYSIEIFPWISVCLKALEEDINHVLCTESKSHTGAVHPTIQTSHGIFSDRERRTVWGLQFGWNVSLQFPKNISL